MVWILNIQQPDVIWLFEYQTQAPTAYLLSCFLTSKKFDALVKYSRDPKSDHLKTGFIRNPDILKVGFQMVQTIWKLDKNVQFSNGSKTRWPPNY